MKSEAKNRTQQFLAVWSSFFPQWRQKKYKVEFESLHFCDFTNKMLTNLFLPDWNHTKYLVKWQGCKNQKTILTTLCLVFNFTCYDFALLFCHDRGVLLLIIHLLSNFDLLIIVRTHSGNEYFLKGTLFLCNFVFTIFLVFVY